MGEVGIFELFTKTPDKMTKVFPKGSIVAGTSHILMVFIFLSLSCSLMAAPLNQNGYVFCGKHLPMAMTVICNGLESPDLEKISKQLPELCCTTPCSTETLFSFCPGFSIDNQLN